MRNTFHLKTLTVAIAALSIASVTNAAGLDRSGQDVTAFFQDGTYAEAVYTYIDADVTGKDSANVVPTNNTCGSVMPKVNYQLASLLVISKTTTVTLLV